MYYYPVDLRAAVLGGAVLLSSTVSYAETVPTIGWVRQLGATSEIGGRGVSVDAQGNAYITGVIRAPLEGQPVYGDEPNSFIAKYSSSGDLNWLRTFIGDGPRLTPEDIEVTAGGTSYIGGTSSYIPESSTKATYLTSFDVNGQLLFNEKSPAFLGSGEFGGLALDSSGNIFASSPGQAGRPRFIKADSDGQSIWYQDVGLLPVSPFQATFIEAIATDESNSVYITGSSNANESPAPTFPPFDIFVQKYNTDGGLIWEAELASDNHDFAVDIDATLSGGVFVVGRTSGDLLQPVQGEWDMVLARYDTNGNQLWANQFGTEFLEEVVSVKSDPLGNSYVAGYTRGSLAGDNEGDYDLFVLKYDPAGNLLWDWQYGSPQSDILDGMDVDANGALWLTGTTFGMLGDPSSAVGGAFLIRLVPEPSCGFILMGLAAAMLRRRSRVACYV